MGRVGGKFAKLLYSSSLVISSLYRFHQQALVEVKLLDHLRKKVSWGRNWTRIALMKWKTYSSFVVSFLGQRKQL